MLIWCVHLLISHSPQIFNWHWINIYIFFNYIIFQYLLNFYSYFSHHNLFLDFYSYFCICKEDCITFEGRNNIIISLLKNITKWRGWQAVQTQPYNSALSFICVCQENVWLIGKRIDIYKNVWDVNGNIRSP